MGLKIEGVIFMALAWTTVLSLSIFRFSKVLSSRRRKFNEDED